MKLELGCKLAYKVKADTPFVFNIEAQNSGSQQVQKEELRLTPDFPVERWTMPESGNRYFRVNVGSGNFLVEYTADVTLTSGLERPGRCQRDPAGQHAALGISPFISKPVLPVRQVGAVRQEHVRVSRCRVRPGQRDLQLDQRLCRI